MKRLFGITALLLMLLLCGIWTYINQAGPDKTRTIPQAARLKTDYSFMGTVYDATESIIQSAPKIDASINGSILVPIRIEKLTSPALNYAQGSTVALQIDNKASLGLKVGHQYLFTTFEKDGHSYLYSIEEYSAGLIMIKSPLKFSGTGVICKNSNFVFAAKQLARPDASLGAPDSQARRCAG